MKKRHKVPIISSKESFHISFCEKCDEQLVKFRNQLVCKACVKIKIKALPFWDAEEVEFGVLYPNREARRKK